MCSRMVNLESKLDVRGAWIHFEFKFGRSGPVLIDKTCMLMPACDSIAVWPSQLITKAL